MERLRYMKCGQGYTLLEVCLALTVLAIMTGFLIPSASGILSEEKLRGVTNRVTDLARSAQHRAVAEGRRQAIVLSGGSLYLLPWNGDNSDLSGAAERIQLSGDMAFELRPGGEALPDPRRAVAWVFQPNGLSNPMEVRIRSGKSWVVERFSPLTATVADERSSFE